MFQEGNALRRIGEFFFWPSILKYGCLNIQKSNPTKIEIYEECNVRRIYGWNEEYMDGMNNICME